MSTQERRFFSGNSIEQALLQAAGHFGVAPERLAYRQIEKRHGFLRKRRGVIIEIDPAAPTKPQTPAEAGNSKTAVESPPPRRPVEPEVDTSEVRHQKPEQVRPWHEQPEGEAESRTIAKEPPGRDEESERATESDEREVRSRRHEESGSERPRRQRAPRNPVVIDDDLIEAAGDALEAIFDVADLELDYEIAPGEERLEIELSGPDRDMVLEDRGSLLLAIQHLMPRLIRGLCGRTAPCRVDCDDFHARNERELEALAVRIATEVKDRQEARTLHPMNPAERRIVHLALAEDAEVETESRGKGFFKRVAIQPVRRRPRGFDRYN